ncbi:MAG: hypothetical protein ACT4OP_10925 [Actinomycetota bacterium]
MKRYLQVLVWAALLAIGGCGFSQVGPWLDESGQRLEGSQLIQYPGFEQCGHQEVEFLVFFGDMYAKDLDGALGELANPAGEILSYALLQEIPEGVTARGFTFKDREIYYDEATLADYLYIHYSNGNTERWPRAESPCDRPGSGA